MVSSKRQVVETKLVNPFMLGRAEKTRGGKYEGIFSDVVENKWWKNVGFRPFHDVDENKVVMVVFPRCV